MTDDIERARRILAEPSGLMLPNNLAKALLAQVDGLTSSLAAYRRAWAAMLPNPGRWPDTPEGVEHVRDAYAIENQRLRDEIAALTKDDDSTKPALDRALDRLGYALDKSRNGA